MLVPSYAELMDVLNDKSNNSDEITSRYTIVIATAKRARQLIEGDSPMVVEKKGKPVSTAVEEIFKNKIKVVPEGEGTVLKLNKDFEEKQEKSGFGSKNFKSKEPLNIEPLNIEELNDEELDEEDETFEDQVEVENKTEPEDSIEENF